MQPGNKNSESGSPLEHRKKRGRLGSEQVLLSIAKAIFKVGRILKKHFDFFFFKLYLACTALDH